MSNDIKQPNINHNPNPNPKPIIQSTWGTGKTKKTMAMHIKNSLFTKLGWEPGDLLIMTPDFEKGTILLEKLQLRPSEVNKKE